MDRTAEIARETAETRIQLRLDLDGTGTSTINTGVGFLDHMLELFAKHGFFDVDIEAAGGSTCRRTPHHRRCWYLFRTSPSKSGTRQSRHAAFW